MALFDDIRNRPWFMGQAPWFLEFPECLELLELIVLPAPGGCVPPPDTGAFPPRGRERRRRAFGQSLRVERRGVSSFRRPRSCVYTYEHERVYAGIGGHGMADVRGCSGVRGRAFRGLVCSRSRMGVRRTGVSAWGCLVACSAGFFGVSLRWPPGPGRNSVHCGRVDLGFLCSG